MNMLVCLVLVFLFVNASAVEGIRLKSSLSKEEDLELERQLKILNKPPIRTIHGKISGDIIDCIDIYKQPAFDHPLLKNHKIQLTTPDYDVDTTTVSELPPNVKHARTELEIQGERCPTGSVPIRRTKKEDLIRAKSIFKLNKLQKENLYKPNAIANTELPKITLMFSSNRNFDRGLQHQSGKALLNVHNPAVQQNSFSRTEMKVVRLSDKDDNHSVIEVGWTVHPQLYGDNRTRLFTFWTADDSTEKGCFDMFCTGFVQTDSTVTLGTALGPISVFKGTQYGITVNVQREAESGNWLFMLQNKKLGYWPGSLFNNFDFATYVAFGGVVGAPLNAPFPPMGNGNLAVPKESAYISEMEVLNANGAAQDLDSGESGVISRPESPCYTLKYFGRDNPSFGALLRYGGPGGYNCFEPDGHF